MNIRNPAREALHLLQMIALVLTAEAALIAALLL